MTETPDVQAIVKGIVAGGEVKDQGEVFAATLDNIEARTACKDLKGGLRAALLPKKTRGGKVSLTLSLHWGDEKSLQGKAMVAELAAEMLQRGTKARTYQDLQDLQDQLTSRVSIGGGADGFGNRIETLRDKLPAALDLAADMMTSPSFPAAQLELDQAGGARGARAAAQGPERRRVVDERAADHAMAQAATRVTRCRRPSRSPRSSRSSSPTSRRLYKEFAGAGIARRARRDR